MHPDYNLLTYTLQIGKTKMEYGGFTRYSAGMAISKSQRIVLASVDGELDIWLTTGSEHSLDQLRLFYLRDKGENLLSLIVLTPEKFIETNTNKVKNVPPE